jgi:hypothetical protein
VSKPQSVFYEDGRVNLRSEIEATLPTERIKLRDGPFNGVTATIESGESRLIITQKQLSSWQRPDIAFEYQRDPKPQFTFTGHREFDSDAPNAIAAEAIDDSDYRQGFLDGLHHAASLVFLEQERSGSDHVRTCLNLVDAIRELAASKNYQSTLLYTLHPDYENRK